MNILRQVVLDTETTGMNKFGVHYEGHKIIEIGAVEIIDRCLTGEKFHIYLNPNRLIDIEAFYIHKISDDFLKNKPFFSEIVDSFLNFIQNSALIIHNASFDVGFLNYELNQVDVNLKKIESYCDIIDTLQLARKIFPGQRNSLDALCERYHINKDKRYVHNALVDAELLANVYLSMTGGQKKMVLDNFQDDSDMLSGLGVLNSVIMPQKSKHVRNSKKYKKLIFANKEEKLMHEKCLDLMEKKYKNCLWRCNKNS